jgi:hypothetical protein
VLWASLTLALLTLPVVIVATEEALAAVPGSMREGSYACGASKWQTIKRIVLPRAMPGIMTGMILAMARGAGEVAPLMLVGAVKLAPELPSTTNWSGPSAPHRPHPPERSFMHLGFHIYDLGFQSQNSEAAKPMVFTTTLLLIGIIVAAQPHRHHAAHPLRALHLRRSSKRLKEVEHDSHEQQPSDAPSPVRPPPQPERPTAWQAIAAGERGPAEIHAALTPPSVLLDVATSASGTATPRRCSTSTCASPGARSPPDRPLRLRQVHAAALGQPPQRPDRHRAHRRRHAPQRRSIYGPASTSSSCASAWAWCSRSPTRSP